MCITTDFFFYLSGSFVSAGSVFFLCLGASYLTSILFVVTLSLGEAVYSPRVYEYTMLLSPKVVYPRSLLGTATATALTVLPMWLLCRVVRVCTPPWLLRQCLWRSCLLVACLGPCWPTFVQRWGEAGWCGHSSRTPAHNQC